MGGGGDEGGAGKTEAGSTSTGAQEEWPPNTNTDTSKR